MDDPRTELERLEDRIGYVSAKLDMITDPALYRSTKRELTDLVNRANQRRADLGLMHL